LNTRRCGRGSLVWTASPSASAPRMVESGGWRPASRRSGTAPWH
jgi:hypothetical protein